MGVAFISLCRRFVSNSLWFLATLQDQALRNLSHLSVNFSFKITIHDVLSHFFTCSFFHNLLAKCLLRILSTPSSPLHDRPVSTALSRPLHYYALFQLPIHGAPPVAMQLMHRLYNKQLSSLAVSSSPQNKIKYHQTTSRTFKSLRIISSISTY